MCGRKFYREFHQGLADLGPLRAHIQKMVASAERQAERRSYWQRSSVHGMYKCTNGKATETLQLSSTSQSTQQSKKTIPGSSNVDKRSASTARDSISSRQRRTGFTGQEPQAEYPTWILIGTQNKNYKSSKYKGLEHIRVAKRADDLTLFRQIREAYQMGRNKWQRTFDLHDVYKISLVKVSRIEYLPRIAFLIRQFAKSQDGS